MSIYTISDLHLPFGVDKPMNIFGIAWKDYTKRLYENWLNTVKDGDTVILPGDLSWATYLKDAYKDFEFINNLPGEKIIMKGNHDYFFTTLSKMNKFLTENKFNKIKILQNNYFFVEDILICGTRGWDTEAQGEEDRKILNREGIRLELSLQNAQKAHPNKDIYAFMHYPPILKGKTNNNVFLEKLNQYNVKKCFYGHLHANGINNAYEGENNNVIFSLVSADHLKFMPLKIN